MHPDPSQSHRMMPCSAMIDGPRCTPAPQTGCNRRHAMRLSALGLVALISGCGVSSAWRTDYPAALDPAVTGNWRVQGVKVTVPDSLTVSDENSWSPDADIVWHGDPEGDRRAQVARVMEEAIRSGAADLHGRRPVLLLATMTQFHAITPAVERYLNFSGVHDIRFTLQVVDARTHAPLTEAVAIEADTPALVGRAARDARARGYSQKDEVIDHVARVIRGWLGTGPDPRHHFSRLGR